MEILNGEGGLALAAVVLFLVAFGLESLALRRQWTSFYAVAFPLGESLVPLPTTPKGKGKSMSLRWMVDDDDRVVRFWTHDRAQLPRGFHGVAWLLPDSSGRVHLDIRWAPLWTPFVACLWLVLLGIVRGEGAMMSTIAVLLSTALLYANWLAAARAAAELRWSLLSSMEEDEES